MACVSCSFDSLRIFLLILKQQQNLMKIMFFWIHFPIWPYPPPPPPNNEKQQHYFILVNCMGWQVWEGDSWEIWGQVQSLARNCPHLGMGGGGGGGGDSSVVRAPDSWLKGRGFESLLERRENFLLQGWLSVLTLISVSVPPPCYHSST